MSVSSHYKHYGVTSQKSIQRSFVAKHQLQMAAFGLSLGIKEQQLLATLIISAAALDDHMGGKLSYSAAPGPAALFLRSLSG